MVYAFIKNTLKKLGTVKNMNQEEKDYFLQTIGYDLEHLEERYGKFTSYADLMLENAKNSASTHFKLILFTNDTRNMFQWCNDEYNFVGACPDTRYSSKVYKTTYTLDELPEAIENAEKWAEGIHGRNFLDCTRVDILGL